MRWRIIDYSENEAAMNMAIDEAVSGSVASGGPPTIRFYGWNPSAVSIGYFQSLADVVDCQRCAEDGIGVVRRRTGGGAVYHDGYGEITYSVIGPESAFPKDIIASYRMICGWVIDSLALLGIPSEFKPINDIITNGKKISGNAQTRRGGVLLQHGTVLYSVDVDRMFSYLRVSDEKIKDKMIAGAKERVTSVIARRNIPREQVYEAMVSGFTRGKDFFMGALGEGELERAISLASTRYSSDAWNAMR
jgi:lipoate-protein ligase A